MIKEMAFVSYPVTDIARAVALYRDTIGLTPGASFGDSVVEFDIGNATFAVDAESIGAPGTQFSAAFEVDDIANDAHGSCGKEHTRNGSDGVSSVLRCIRDRSRRQSLRPASA